MGEKGGGRADRRVTLPAEAMRALQERFRASGMRTVESFRALAAQLTVTPTATEVVDAVRRELHRVHGTAGSYGYHEASRLAGKLEGRAVRWAADGLVDHEQRGAMIEQFAGVLELAFGVGLPSTGPTTVDAERIDVTLPASNRSTKTDDAPDVVLVEDDSALADMVVYALRAAGYHVEAYANGPDALARLLSLRPKRGQRPLVLLDVDLPGLDGHSLHEQLRIERPGAFSVVFQTVHAGEVEQIRALHSGALDYVIKPINLRVLLAKMPTWLRQAAAPA
ncbi:MAG TPA: response regulator [Gemmatimonadaceae bacterium]|jgi:CheY-like chemotaxis protein|nr:response regulator [Gemmatimonadaceae bacterium]